MFCKRLPLRFAVPAFLSKLLCSELKSLKINRRIRLFKRSSLSGILFTREVPHHKTIIKVRKYKCLIKTEHGFSRHQFAKPCHNAKLIVYLFTYRGRCLNVRSLSVVTPKSSTESFTEKLN